MEQVTEISQRFKAIIGALGMNNNSFAKSIGKTSTTINYIADGRNKPSFDVLEAIFEKYPQINPSWLITGEGEMFLSLDPKDTPPDTYLQDYLKQLEERFEKLLNQKDKLIESQQYLIEHLSGQLGKPECDTETGVIEKKHPATTELQKKVTVQTA